jgi:lipoprotein-releasing system permease protein
MIPDRLSWSVALNGLSGSGRLTVLTMIVVSVSVILVIFLSSLIEGLRLQLVAETTGAIPHIVVKPLEKEPIAPNSLSTPDRLVLGKRTPWTRQREKIEDWRRWSHFIAGFSDEIAAVSPSVDGQGFAAVAETREAVRIYGVEPEKFDQIVSIQENLTAGRFYRLAPGEVVIGRGLGDTLGIVVGDRLRVTTSIGTSSDKRVAGVFSTGFGQLDDGALIMPIGDAQSLYGLGSAVTSIGIRTADVFRADMLADRIARQVPYEVRSWTDDNQRLLGALEAQKRSSDMITFFTAVAAAFAIASILIVLVTNKLTEIGILKAMGATRRQIRTIFALQGTMLATFGGLIGTGLGMLLVEGLSRIEVEKAGTGRVEGLFPFALTPELIIGTIVMAALLGFLAALLPAKQAAEVDPIEVIRGG